jgi:hypothetical protein
MRPVGQQTLVYRYYVYDNLGTGCDHVVISRSRAALFDYLCDHFGYSYDYSEKLQPGRTIMLRKCAVKDINTAVVALNMVPVAVLETRYG